MSPSREEVSLILAVGELVWDIFPERRVLGGAPVNVAYHLARLGQQVQAVTRIGNDALGAEARLRLEELGLSSLGVQEDAELPTGQVRVRVDGDGEPQFEIVAPAAWDAIALDPPLSLVGDRPFALVHGTLAQRDPRSRATIRALRESALLRCYDVNLRPPFTTAELVGASLAGADLVKVNSRELAILAEWFALPGEEKEAARALCARFGVSVLAVSTGEKGAWLVAGGDFFSDPGVTVRVADTVGAGDAFFAALLDGYLRGRPWPEILQESNRRGAYVASRPGATPPMPSTLPC